MKVLGIEGMTNMELQMELQKGGKYLTPGSNHFVIKGKVE